jgi:hypothetical protein
MSVKIAIAAGMLLAAQGLSASAATYTYVGSWTVSPSFEQDPTGALYWQNNPSVFTGQEAAAYLFGGTAADYVISTVSSLVDDINFSAWLDGWGDDVAYATGGTPAAQDFSYDGVDGSTPTASRCAMLVLSQPNKGKEPPTWRLQHSGSIWPSLSSNCTA